MKRIVLSLLTMVLFAGSMNAQNLYRTVYDKATAIVNSANASEEELQLNQFKVTCLNYISMMVQQKNLKKDNYFYDSQAVSLTSFVTDFQVNLYKARAISTEKRLEVIKLYRDATLHNPLFKDTNTERTLCYVNDLNSLTPFSIDTDWEKAYEQTTTMAKSLFSKK